MLVSSWLMGCPSAQKVHPVKQKQTFLYTDYLKNNFLLFNIINPICITLYQTSCRHCLLRRASAIAHDHTPKIVLRSAIFSTPKSGKIKQNITKCTPTAHLNILRSAICSTTGIFKRQGL